MNAYEQEKIAIAWIFTTIFSWYAGAHITIIIILAIQSLISLIASIITSYKQHGTKKRKTSRKAGR
jgi:hypothetical protein